MSFARFNDDGSAGFLRCDQPEVARHQLHMSIGLVVVLCVATTVAMIATSFSVGTGNRAPSVATLAAPAPATRIVRAEVRQYPMYRMQASRRVGADSTAD